MLQRDRGRFRVKIVDKPHSLLASLFPYRARHELGDSDPPPPLQQGVIGKTITIAVSSHSDVYCVIVQKTMNALGRCKPGRVCRRMCFPIRRARTMWLAQPAPCNPQTTWYLLTQPLLPLPLISKLGNRNAPASVSPPLEKPLGLAEVHLLAAGRFRRCLRRSTILSHSNQTKGEKEESPARDKEVGFFSVKLSSYRLLHIACYRFQSCS